ncbi:MAG TPA: cytochrome c [Chthonomonadaceae bacterium]|nr:cytochrome c [Chthonomonadaceae bacterium]
MMGKEKPVSRLRIGRPLRAGLMLGSALSLVLLAGCHWDMWIQPKALPLQRSAFFPNQMASRPPVPNTVEHTFGQAILHTDNPYFTGMANGKLVTQIPAEAFLHFPGNTPQERLRAMLERGQDRFTIFCTPCHGALGDGNGMIAQRGFALRRQPGNYHTDRLRNMPDGHFFDVITNGYGVMFSYASRVQDPADRWAIVAYIRALQLSQHATTNDVPPAEMQRLQAEGAAQPGGTPIGR